MGIQQFTESEMEELSLRFRGILAIDNKIEELGENLKTYNSSKTEGLKAISEKMELKPKEVKAGYNAYLKALRKPAEVEAEDEVFVFIKEYDMLKQEPKKE